MYFIFSWLNFELIKEMLSVLRDPCGRNIKINNYDLVTISVMGHHFMLVNLTVQIRIIKIYGRDN